MEIMKLLVMQYSSVPCYTPQPLTLKSKFLFYYLIIENSLPLFIKKPSCTRV